MSDETERMIGRIDGKLDRVLDELTRHFDDDERRFGELGHDVTKLQKKINWFSGVGAAIVAGISLLSGKH